jgi:hypothetical protein
MPTTFQIVRAEALFVSTVQSSDLPPAEQVRLAVAGTLRAVGIRGCAARVAGEFGDHPETAVTRMRWALDAVRTAYPRRPVPRLTRAARPEPGPQAEPLAKPLAMAA